MNIDFHYYGTLAGALLAGFSLEEAKIIAHSAEYVDEYTPEVIAKCRMDMEHATPTCVELVPKNYVKELLKSNMEHAAIWMCFHFLPGFCHEYYLERGSKVASEKLNLLCRPNGRLTDAMLRRYLLNGLSPKTLQRLRCLIGIGMNCHIYADSWAHADFAGIHSQELNGVKGDATEISNPYHPVKLGLIFYDEQATKPFALGHGALGHIPDESDKYFNYYPSWLQHASIKAYARCNYESFYDAFLAMTNYLSRVRTNGYVPILDQRTLDLIRNMMKSDPQFAVLKWKNFIRTECGIQEDQYQFNREEWIDEYLAASDKTKTCLYLFNQCATAQQKYVMDCINSKLLSQISKENYRV